ncbi:MAG TPA: hypothetical protein VKV04_23250 [Verrucomicrobiae bacterium]|nr:hypothetical protein [Verrucomicrobiae bacterium]
MKRLLVIAAGIALASSVYAQEETFRTLAAGTGLYQSTNGAGKPAYATQEILGHDLVASALGIPLGTVLTNNQVLALQIDCGSTAASLVAWDNSNSVVLAQIAVCSNLTVVQQQDNDLTPGPNREHFTGEFTITPGNNLLGGSLTIAGRLQLDPTNGCPRAIRVSVDKLDRLFKDVDSVNPDDPKNKDILRAGLAHAVGKVSLVFVDGSTNEVLLPFMELSIRHKLQ